MNYRQKVGKFGETLAKNYLIRHGYTILDMNIKISYQEVDIIASQGKLIVFVEVKTRIFLGWGGAEEAFDDQKMANLVQALDLYIYEKKLDENFIRVDLIAIDIDRSKKIAKIKHYKNAI